jgi:hypothetical protein
MVATVTVTGQAGFSTANAVEAWISGMDSTVDHSTFDHSIVPMRPRPTNPVNGVGFDIICVSDVNLTGIFVIHWVWA